MKVVAVISFENLLKIIENLKIQTQKFDALFAHSDIRLFPIMIKPNQYFHPTLIIALFAFGIRKSLNNTWSLSVLQHENEACPSGLT